MSLPYVFANLTGPIPLAFLDANFNYIQTSGGAGTIGFDAITTYPSGSVGHKLQDIVSVKDAPFNAKGDGVADDTAAIQQALSSGAKAIFIPHGRYNFTSLVIPQIVGFQLYGEGTASVLVQKGTGMKWPTLSVNCFNGFQTISNIAFDGTAGTGNTLDTTFVQTLEMSDLFFTNVPVGFASLKMDGNPTSATYMHDVRISGIRIYHDPSGGHGKTGIQLGSYASDSAIDKFVMQGFFLVDYCILADPGAVTIAVSNSHPFNAKINVVKMTQFNSDWRWTAVIFDNSLSDNFYSRSTINHAFTNCWFESINPGVSALVLDDSYQFHGSTTNFNALSTAQSCIREINGSLANRFDMVTVEPNLAAFTNPFDLTGVESVVLACPGHNPYGSVYSLSGCIQTPQTQNTTKDLGANGTQPSLVNTAWSTPLDGEVLFARIFTEVTPPVGETFTFNLRVNGTTIGTAQIANTSVGCVIVPANRSIGQGSQISIQSIGSLNCGTFNPRYSVTLAG